MKKIFLSALLLASISTSVMYAQKSKKGKTPQVNPISIQTSADTISYAYGASLAEQGLEQYLLQAKVIADTTIISTEYNTLIANATNQKEKAKLEKELKFKLDSISTSNTQNLELFLTGVNERFQAPDQNPAYSSGLDIGTQLNRMSEEFAKQMLNNDSEQINKQLLLEGLASVLTKQPLLIPNSTEIMQKKMQEGQQKETDKKKAASAEVIAKGEKFMAENATKEGVVTLPSGLQYKIIKEGTGAIPTKLDQVKVHYHGTLIDGTVFDSSVNRGEPITLGITQVIPGWTEALQLMPVGSKWELYVPYNLAYGDRDSGPIAAYSDLIFEVELLGIE